MAPHAAPLPLAAAHRGWRSDDDDDDSPRWRQPSASSTAAADSNNVAQFPGVEADTDGGNSVNPVAIILPVLAGVALLLLAVGGFLIWRRRRRAAAAAAAASDTSTEMRASTTASESAQDLRGGAGEFAYGEKYYPGQTEVPPRYEESQRDRSVSVTTATTVSTAAKTTDDPFNDAYAYPPRDRHSRDDGHDESPVSPVSESAADRGVTADGYRHDGR